MSVVLIVFALLTLFSMVTTVTLATRPRVSKRADEWGTALVGVLVVSSMTLSILTLVTQIP